MSGQHAYFAPSSFHMMMACVGSVQAQAAFPEPPPDADTLDGEAAHWAASQIFQNETVCEGLVAPNGTALTIEMLEAAEMYVDFVMQRIRTANDPNLHWEVEQPIQITDVHDTLCFGTPDTWFYSPFQGSIDVPDFKFGHRYVDEFENWQLIGYVAGILRKLGINGMGDQVTTVNLHVIQPRCYIDGPIRTWTVRASDLRGYFNRLRNQADAALQPNPPCTPNEHCIDCRARHACVALQKDGYRSAQVSSRSAPLQMDAAAVGLELKFMRDASQRLKARITGLEQQAESMLRNGETVPYSMMVSSSGRSKWNKPVTEVLTLGRLYMKDISKPDVMTPTQAIKAGIPEDVVAMYCERSSGLKLVADDGKMMRKIFDSR